MYARQLSPYLYHRTFALQCTQRSVVCVPPASIIGNIASSIPSFAFINFNMVYANNFMSYLGTFYEPNLWYKLFHMLGYVRWNCYAEYKCMECGESHSTHECLKPKTTPPKCANCWKEHLSLNMKCNQQESRKGRRSVQNFKRNAVEKKNRRKIKANLIKERKVQRSRF